ncbi:hypothetical protein OIO90_000755 [Microbotryomycetes sp. JL221]|nr:hypothetical protein OIO90_000755 [Microbotryomycetes sp. JL221]
MSDTIDVLVIGFGALGTIYGWILSQNKHVRVTAIARSNYETFQKQGVTIESEKFGLQQHWKPFRLCQTPDQANDRRYDFVVATFKCLPDLLPTASILSPFLEGGNWDDKKTTACVLIQNGLGVEHPVQTAFPDVPVISCVAWIGANLKPNALVTHGALEKLVIGLYQGEGRGAELNPISGETTDKFADPAGYEKPGGEIKRQEGLLKTEQFANLLKQGGGEVEIAKDIQPRRYEKNIWNAAWSSLCSLSRSTLSSVVSPEILPFTLPVVRRTMLEVLYVARAWGYDESVLPMKVIDDAIKITIKNYQRASGLLTPATPGPSSNEDAFGSTGYGFPTNDETSLQSTVAFKPSMLLDIEANRPCELEPIIGAVLDRARAKQVATPRLDLVYTALKVHQDMVVRAYAERDEYKVHMNNWAQRRPAIAGAGFEGRRAWEKAMKAQRQVYVEMARGQPRVAGRAVNLASSSTPTDEVVKDLHRFD